jgi:hypothetical protein
MDRILSSETAKKIKKQPKVCGINLSIVTIGNTDRSRL